MAIVFHYMSDGAFRGLSEMLLALVQTSVGAVALLGYTVKQTKPRQANGKPVKLR